MSDFDDFLAQLKKELSALAKSEVAGHVNAFLTDADQFVAETRSDLEMWTAELAQGQMTPEGFELAVRGKAEVLKLRALTEAGLAAVKIDRLKAAILDRVVSAAKKALLPGVA